METADPEPSAATPAGAFAFVRALAGWFAKFPRPVTLVVIGLLLETAFVSGLPLLFQRLIDDAIVPRRSDVLVVLLLTLLVAALVASAVSVGRDYLYARLITRVSNDLRVRLFARLQRLPADFFKRNALAGVSSRFSGDMGSVEQALASLIAWLALPALDILLGMVLLFIIDWRLALLAQLLWPLSLAGPQWLGPRATHAAIDLRDEQARVLASVEEATSGQAVIRVFGLRDHMVDAFGRSAGALVQRGVRVHFLSSMIERSSGIGIRLMQVIVLGVGGWFAFHGSMSIGALVAFQSLFTSVAFSLGWITQYVPVLLQAGVGLGRIDMLLRDAVVITDAPDATPLPADWRQLEVDHVRFVPDGRVVLDDVSLTIRRGESIALVGPSGSGKSTLLNMLMRFNEPTSGAIRLDGRDIRTGTHDSLAQQQAAVFQESFLFNTSIRENVRMGRISATDAEVEAAGAMAGLGPVVANLSEGYDAAVGERGCRLSGGQRQRVAIARALLRDPGMLLLDEATSALDVAMEAEINETLATVRRGRTVISVSHRLASITDYDTIAVFEDGRLVEQGRHEQLLALEGTYAALWQKQGGFTVNAAGDRAEVNAQRLRDVPLLSVLSLPVLERLAGRFVTERVPEGRVVVQQGDPGDRFYIVVRGVVNVSVAVGDRQEEVATLSAGDHFGEIALLGDAPRTATIRTTVPCIFISLGRSEFAALMEESPELRGVVAGQAELRLNELSAVGAG
ncbi:MAG: putative multidrug export ATP-binding/permease protein [Gemmatimonadetes bacterium]|nr:putative multidrug export ATP-binding/permease protein [Gemmatimonadota bacterium]